MQKVRLFWSSNRWLSSPRLLIILLFFYYPYPLIAGVGGGYERVDLDNYITTNRPQKEGTRLVIKPRNIETLATLMRHPEKREVKYLYTALSIWHVDPMPEVNYRMFIRSPGGAIIPVYVEDRIVEALNKTLKEGDEVIFKGYHAYTYAKGPAIVVESFIQP